MQKTTLILVACASLLCIFSTCRKQPDATPIPPTPEEELPAITQVGKNTFGCLVNGKAYVKCASLLDGNPVTGGGDPLHVASGLPNYRSFSIDTKDLCSEDSAKQFETIHLTIWLNEDNSVFVKRSIYANYNQREELCRGIGEDFQNFDTLSPVNLIRINRLDQTNRVISGQFEFDLYTLGCTDTIHLRKGRFDVKY
jgi:hypothetical protein